MSPVPDIIETTTALNEGLSLEDMNITSSATPPSTTIDPSNENTVVTLPEPDFRPPTTALKTTARVFINRASNAMRRNSSGNPSVEGRPASAVHRNENSGFFDSLLGCIKPIFSAVNKFGENIKQSRGATLAKSTDEWEIPIDDIMNDLEFIGTGIEGSVFRGKRNNEEVACKRVKSKEETNIKHLRKLDHVNVVKFRGISVAPPLFYIVMDFCAYGSLYDVLKRRRESNTFTRPTQVLDWSRQIASGVEYLHSNQIVHRDLKSPNILFSDQHTLKISDFGMSKELNNRPGQIMSWSGTSAWMAPEMIRREPCSEKIDVWSFGIVLWEILTCGIPYGNIDPGAVIYGVGKGTLTLLIPAAAPEDLKQLMGLCWTQEPSVRPSFREIIEHLDNSKANIDLFEQEQEYAELTRVWSIEINERLSQFPPVDISSTLCLSADELIKKRQKELQHIVDIRRHYQRRVEEVDVLREELKSCLIQLEQRERAIREKERLLKIHTKKQTSNPIVEARKKSMELYKMVTASWNDPMFRLLRTKRSTKKSDYQTPVIAPSTDAKTVVPPPKTQTRRRKAANVRRTAASTDGLTVVACTTAPLPSISAEIDSRPHTSTSELNLDFSIPPRKSSSSGAEDGDLTQSHPIPRPRVRRTTNASQKAHPATATSDTPKHAKNVTFQLSPVTQRKLTKQLTYSSSEEGEVDESHSDSFSLDDEKHRARHQHSSANFSSEGETFGGQSKQSSSKHDGKPSQSRSHSEPFSDEGGHVSDDRPPSRESVEEE